MRAALARQIFLNANPSQLSDSLLPLAMVSLQRGIISWIDPYMVQARYWPATTAACASALLTQRPSRLS